MRIQAVETQLVDHFFGQRAAGAFGEDGDFGAKFVAGGEVVFGLAVFVDAFVFGDDAGDAVAFVDQFPTGELGEKIDAFLFDEAAEPFDQFVEGDDVIAVILQRRRSDWGLQGFFFGEVVDRVAGDGRIERGGFLEIGNEFAEAAGIHDGAGKLVGADFAAFFKNVDIFGGKGGSFVGRGVFFEKIGEMQGAGQAAGACAYD